MSSNQQIFPRLRAAPFSKRFAKRQTTNRHFTFVKDWDTPVKRTSDEEYLISKVSPRAQVIISPPKPVRSVSRSKNDLSTYVRNSPIPVVIHSPATQGTCKAPNTPVTENGNRSSLEDRDGMTNREDDGREHEQELSVQAQVSNISVSESEMFAKELEDREQDPEALSYPREEEDVDEGRDTVNMECATTELPQTSQQNVPQREEYSSDADDMDSTAAVASGDSLAESSNLDDKEAIDISDNIQLNKDETRSPGLLKNTRLLSQSAQSKKVSESPKSTFIRSSTSFMSPQPETSNVDNPASPLTVYSGVEESGSPHQLVVNSHVSRSSSRGTNFLRESSDKNKSRHISHSEALKLAEKPKNVSQTENITSSHSYNKTNRSLAEVLEEEEEEVDEHHDDEHPSRRTKKQTQKPRKRRAGEPVAVTVPLWQGNFHRTKASVTDLDLVLDTVIQTLKQERDKHATSAERKAVKNLCGYITQGITATIERLEETKSAKSELRRTKSNINGLKKNLVVLQQRKARLLMDKNENAKVTLRKWSINKWVNDMHDLMRSSKHLQSQQLSRSICDHNGMGNAPPTANESEKGPFWKPAL